MYCTISTVAVVFEIKILKQSLVLHGQETVSIFIANLHAIFNDILCKTMGLSFIADYDSERVCRWGVFLNSVRLMGLTRFNAFPF